MIALAPRPRSCTVFCGHDADSGPCALRLPPARAQASRGMQATVVQRQGSSRTTYYTYQRVADSPRPSTVQLEGGHRKDEGVVSKPATSPTTHSRAKCSISPSPVISSGPKSCPDFVQDGTDCAPVVSQRELVPASGRDGPTTQLNHFASRG